MPEVQNLYRANNYENLNAQSEDDDLNFSHFDDFKNKSNQYSENSNSNQKVDQFEDFLNTNNENIDDSIKEEDDNDELKDIFSNDIEEVLPELFGEYKKNSSFNSIEKEFNEKPKETTKAKNSIKPNASPVQRLTAPLGFSSNHNLDHDSDDSLNSNSNSIQSDNRVDINKSTSSDNGSLSLGSDNENDDDYTPIDKNAFKNFRIESNNTFVLDDSKSNLKDLITSKNDYNNHQIDPFNNYNSTNETISQIVNRNIQNLNSPTLKADNNFLFLNGLGSSLTLLRLC